jgi:predicted NUDIX family NTP pyrophosphohydrolase
MRAMQSFCNSLGIEIKGIKEVMGYKKREGGKGKAVWLTKIWLAVM